MGEMCRLCLSEKDVLIPIFYRGSDLPDHIKACLAVQVSNEEPHKHICITCDGKLRYWWTFKLEIQSAQKFLNNQYSKSLYSRTVTSSEENQSPSGDATKSIFDRVSDQSPIKVKSCHSLALTGGHEFEESLGFNESNGPTAVIIKQEKPDYLTDGRGPVQVVPVSAAVDSNAYYQSSNLDVSSSSGGNAGSSKTTGRRNSLRSMAQADDDDDDDGDDCMIIEPPPKRKCPLVTIDTASQKKRQKMNSDAAKKSQNNKVPPTGRKKPGPKVGWKLALRADSKPSDPTETAQQAVVSEPMGPKKCQYCPSVFSTKHEYMVHMKYHTLLGNIGRQSIPCPYCSNSVQVYSLPGHVKNVHKMDPDAAGIPNYIETKMGTKKMNQPSVKAVNGMKIVVFSCNLCKNSYKTLFALKMHKKRHHSNMANSNPLKQRKVKNWGCVCNRCKRQLISREGLALHHQYCGTDRASVCPFCAMEFETVLRLKRHIGQKHNGSNDVNSVQRPVTVNSTNLGAVAETQAVMSVPQRGYVSEWKNRKSTPQCLKCTRKFIVKEKLQNHAKYCGTDKSVKCYFCPEHYNSVGSMNNHSKRIHNKTVFPCDFCTQKFSTKVEVDEHRKIHKQLLKSKLYHKCRGCQNVYHGLASFNNHKLKCKSDFAHKCEKCFLRFQEQNSLDIHFSQCTGKAQLEEKLKLAFKAVKCLQCTNRFTGENEFINHYVQSHVNAANSIFSGVNLFDCHFCFFAANNPNSVKNHIPHCRGISFYVVKTSVKKQGQSTGKTSVNVTSLEQSQSEIETKIPSTPKSSGRPGEEITKICSPSFMNEHLNASKNAQVVVEKLSDTLIHNVSNLKREKTVFIKQEPSKPRAVLQTPSPKVKCQCQYCKRWFTPAGLPTHKCHKKKKIQARMRSQSLKKEQAKQLAAPSTNAHLIKCELCYDMVQQEALPEHLKVIHQAVKPAEMARSMIELSMMKQALNTHLVKEEVQERNETEDAAGGNHSDDEANSQNESPDNEIEAVEAEANEEIDEEAVMNDMVEEVENEDADEAESDHGEENMLNSGDELEAESLKVSCDICHAAFTMPDLEAHLKNVHHAVNPAAMARTMMENSITFPKLTLNNSAEDLQEEFVKTRCDICKSFFTLPDLEAHLKNVHHAVNPSAMAQTMMENNLSFSRITVNIKSECGPDSEDGENSNPEDSQDSGNKEAEEDSQDSGNKEAEEDSQDSGNKDAEEDSQDSGNKEAEEDSQDSGNKEAEEEENAEEEEVNGLECHSEHTNDSEDHTDPLTQCSDNTKTSTNSENAES